MVVEVLEEEYYESCSEREASYADLSPGLADQLDCPVLVTDRLVLRPPHTEDVDAISYLANNARVSTMLARMPHPYTRENAVDFVERVRKGEMGNCIYAITQAETGIFMGCCGIHPHSHGEGRRSAIGWVSPIGAWFCHGSCPRIDRSGFPGHANRAVACFVSR